MGRLLAVVAVLIAIWGALAVLGAVFEFIDKLFRSGSAAVADLSTKLSEEEVESQLMRFVNNEVSLGKSWHHIDDLTVTFLRTVLPDAYRPREREYLRSWDQRPNIPEKIKAIRNRANSTIGAKLEELRKQDNVRRESEAQREREEMTRKAQVILTRNADKVNKFVEIAYRKVATPDDYGDENPAALEVEVRRAIQKLGESEADLASAARDLKDKHRATLALWDPLVRAVVQELTNRFGMYYKQRKDGGSANDVGTMSGLDFELHIAELLRKAGVRDVATTPATGDQGGDLLFTSNGKRYVVQAKRYTGTVGNKAVQEAHAAKGYYQCDHALVVTSSQFTPAARTLAKELAVVLVDGDHLVDLHRFIA